VIDAQRQQPMVDVITVCLEHTTAPPVLDPAHRSPRHRNQRVRDRQSHDEDRDERRES
jgi:hypothetical protein